ncbi:hypothetical protein MSKOL_0111 [Methanosarcina sp. Kolksee]|nr:hypothetical protein MSKOL_0111 [Methanosarcina sp. Kolksee]
MTLEYIKKLRGWCLNAKMLETQHSIHSKYFEASDQAKGRDAGSLPVLPTGWWNKRHNRALVISSGLTLFSVLGIGFLGIHPMDKGFIFGLTIGTIFNLLLCIWNWHFLNKIKNTGKKIKKNIVSPKWRIINLLLSLVLLYLFFSQFNWGLILFFISAFCLIALFYYFNFDSTGLVVLLGLSSFLGWKYIIAFLSGFCLTAFLYYLTDMYWEKRNGKIIIVYGRKMPGVYIVNK